ncbi:MAG: DUF4430 domain-containing protein [Oscillospiraceae bacterium]|nr:DUF4430 domain-containing protein [Oscillospiraceae bacterium]MBQ8835732.1 DUF4430 domain-containing protein [Oscillospiraceae bacterium]
MKRVLSLILVLLIIATLPVNALAAEDTAIREAFETTGDYMAALGDPSAGSTGGEWMALGFARSGREVPDSYYDSVVAYVDQKIDDNGRLHATKCTTNCRFTVALTAIGKDPTNVGGHNLLAGLNDMGYIRKVGVSGVIWTLIAFDCGKYEMPEGINRETLVDTILDFQVPGGGWATSGNIADPDVTSMAIQALAPYREDADVQSALDAAITVLAGMLDETGNFPSQYGASSESVSQVIVALCTLGIDPNTDERFVKNGMSALDGLLGYYVEGGGFKHIHSGKVDGIATEQGYYALTAYFRMLEGKTPLYDMTDGFTVTPQKPTVQEQRAQDNNMVWLWVVLAVGAALLVLCFALKKKLGKKKFSNAIMVVIILLISVLGIGFVIQTGVLNQKPALGSEFKTAAIPDNRLVTSENTENICTITIRCDTVLDNQNLLEEAKVPYVPADGVILPEITVEFTPGENVFDVLQRVCEAADIPLEYSWTPLYDSYYLEGICHLYEFDCGAESGWMYQVNGTFPNYGCSSYEVKPGDKIEWLYSCIGLGADLGADVMEG